LPPIPAQVNLIRNLTPKMKRLGTIYNPGEANSVAVISRLRDYVRSNGSITMVEGPIANSADVPTVLAALQGRIDGLYLPPDNTAHAAIPVIGRFCSENKLPLFATTRNAIDSGALATLALDFVRLGRESADLALQALGGKDPGSIPIQVNQNPAVTISAKVARQLEIDLTAVRNQSNVTIVDK